MTVRIIRKDKSMRVSPDILVGININTQRCKHVIHMRFRWGRSMVEKSVRNRYFFFHFNCCSFVHLNNSESLLNVCSYLVIFFFLRYSRFLKTLDKYDTEHSHAMQFKRSCIFWRYQYVCLSYFVMTIRLKYYLWIFHCILNTMVKVKLFNDPLNNFFVCSTSVLSV